MLVIFFEGENGNWEKGGGKGKGKGTEGEATPIIGLREGRGFEREVRSCCLWRSRMSTTTDVEILFIF